MHLIPMQALTLADVAEAWKTHERTWNSDACVPEVSFKGIPKTEPTLSLGDHKITLDDNAIAQLCTFYKIPTAFFGRLTPGEKHFVMNSRIDYAEGEVTVAYTETGVTDVRKPTQPRLDPEEFIATARRLYPADSRVLKAACTPEYLHLDVISAHVPYPSEAGFIYGGIRLAQNRKQNLAPTVSPILFHEDSTTTIEVIDYSLRIDARGVSVEKVAERLAAEALRADARIGHDIGALVNLALIPIEGDRITRLHRVAAEFNMPVRPLADITVAMSRTDKPTMFDLVVAIANTANSPKLRESTKRATRTRLQTIAGSIVNDHAERCGSCLALVT